MSICLLYMILFIIKYILIIITYYLYYVTRIDYLQIQ